MIAVGDGVAAALVGTGVGVAGVVAAVGNAGSKVLVGAGPAAVGDGELPPCSAVMVAEGVPRVGAWVTVGDGLSGAAVACVVRVAVASVASDVDGLGADSRPLATLKIVSYESGTTTISAINASAPTAMTMAAA